MLARVSLLLAALVAAASSLPQLPPGVDPATCPNYPFCGEGPAGAPSGQSAVYITIITKVPQCPKGSHITITHFYYISSLKALAAHAAAEAAVRAQQAQGPGLVGPSGNIGPSGQVGASGNIGPSGLCGPSGCVAFGK